MIRCTKCGRLRNDSIIAGICDDCYKIAPANEIAAILKDNKVTVVTHKELYEKLKNLLYTLLESFDNEEIMPEEFIDEIREMLKNLEGEIDRK